MQRLSALQSKERDLLIVEKRLRSDMVIGVPHHAPSGTPRLPCPEHSDSDENTGFIGRYLAQTLNCSSVIACNSTIDPNKHLNSDYSRQIVAWNPNILIEIHGHGKIRSKYDVEISCGSAERSSSSEKLAAEIKDRLAENEAFKNISVCGRFCDIYFKATKTPTITDPRWRAYHIELSSRLRKPISGGKGKPTELAYKFSDCLAKALTVRCG